MRTWSDWEANGKIQTKTKVDEHGWTHELIATAAEENPRANHVHIKYRKSPSDGSAQLVTCSIKLNGRHEFDRHTMLCTIESVTGLDLPFEA